MAGVAAVGVFWAVWLVVRGDPGRRLRPVPVVTSSRSRWAGRWPYAGAVLAGVLAAVVAGPLIGLAAALFAVAAAWLATLYRRRRLVARRRSGVVQACQTLAALLRVGQVPSAALETAAEDVPVIGEVAAVRRAGGEVVPVLRRLGTVPGRDGLIELANAWEVAERTGARLTTTLDALAERFTAQDEVRQVVEAELAAPRATGRLLAALPVAGVALGFFMGGDPLAFLFGSVFGQAVFVVGIALACAGMVWTERIADDGG